MKGTLLSAIVRLMKDAGGLRLTRGSRCGRDARHLAPGAEGGVACGAVLVGGRAVAAELEMVVNVAAGREEPLRVAR